jgi:hypothetical protein
MNKTDIKNNDNKYRKKNVIIEAMQITTKTEQDIKNWSEGKVYSSPVLEPTKDNISGIYWQIDTLEGTITAISGDFIIKVIKNDFYLCKPDIFEKTYEKI